MWNHGGGWRKRGETQVTSAELVEAQLVKTPWVEFPLGDSSRVRVECPVAYHLDKITAADIVNDDAIRIVTELTDAA